MPKIEFKIVRADGLPSFGAYLSDSINDPEKGLILLDVEAHFGDVFECEDGSNVDMTNNDRMQLMIQTLMHEFGHALEDFYKKEFDEDWIDSIVESWKSKYA